MYFRKSVVGEEVKAKKESVSKGRVGEEAWEKNRYNQNFFFSWSYLFFDS